VRMWLKEVMTMNKVLISLLALVVILMVGCAPPIGSDDADEAMEGEPKENIDDLEGDLDDIDQDLGSDESDDLDQELGELEDLDI